MLSLADALATAAPQPTPYLVGLILGFVLAAAGHVVKAPLVIIAGIAIIGLTVLMWLIASEPSF